MKTYAVCLSLLALAGIAQAQNLSYFTDLSVMVDENHKTLYEVDNPNLMTLSVADPTGNAWASGQMAPGVARVAAGWDSLDANSPATTLMADASAYWIDTVLISDPNLDGTLGTFTASLRVFGSEAFSLAGAYASGDPYSDAQVYGFWDSWIGVSTDGGGSYLVGGWFGDWQSDADGTIWYIGDELNQPQTEVTLEFIYGQPFLLRMNLEAYIDADNPNVLPGTVSGALDFSHSAYWNGIGGFYDADDNEVAPSFWSQSGVDWRNAVVPEPATIVALGVPAAFLALRRRSRKSS